MTWHRSSCYTWATSAFVPPSAQNVFDRKAARGWHIHRRWEKGTSEHCFVVPRPSLVSSHSLILLFKYNPLKIKAVFHLVAALQHGKGGQQTSFTADILTPSESTGGSNETIDGCRLHLSVPVSQERIIGCACVFSAMTCQKCLVFIRFEATNEWKVWSCKI